MPCRVSKAAEGPQREMCFTVIAEASSFRQGPQVDPPAQCCLAMTKQPLSRGTGHALA